MLARANVDYCIDRRQPETPNRKQKLDLLKEILPVLYDHKSNRKQTIK